MFWALVSSVFIIYLYRKLNRERVEPQDTPPANALEAEWTALNAQITALEAKLGHSTTEDRKS